MLKIFFLLAYRKLKKNYFTTIINVFGLSIGLTVYLFISGYITFESSFDKSPISKQVFRVQNNYIRFGELIYNSAATYAGVGPYMKEYFPQVEKYARYYAWGRMANVDVKYTYNGNTVSYREKDIAYADQDLLELLEIKLLNTQTDHPLTNPNNAIISESTALKYFGHLNVIDETLTIQSDVGLTDEVLIIGVFEDIPENKHTHFNVIISYPTLHNQVSWRGLPGRQSYEQDMGGYYFYTYIKLYDPSGIGSITAAMPGFVDKYKPPFKAVDESGERLRKNEFTFTNIEDIHLYSSMPNEYESGGNFNSINILGILAIIVILLAWINYTNLFTATSLERAKETGIRQVMGSNKKQLILQFTGESLLINLIALLISIVLVSLFIPAFEEISGWRFSFSSLTNTGWLISSISVFTIGVCLTGIYTSLIMTNNNPVNIIKGKITEKNNTSSFRKILLSLQLVLSIGIAIITLGIYHQSNFMLTGDNGFNDEAVLVIEKPSFGSGSSPDIMFRKLENFKNELRSVSSISSVSSSNILPGKGILRGNWVTRDSVETDDQQVYEFNAGNVDHQFISTLEFNLISGRDFHDESGLDSSGIIINRVATEELGYSTPEEAIGDHLILNGRFKYRIIGVIEDYHHESFHIAIDPVYFILSNKADAFIALKINSFTPELVKRIENSYRGFFPDQSFNYFFMEDFYAQQYNGDKKFLSTFKLLTLIALLIAGIGLFGLMTISVTRRLKEFGIRKILGAPGVQLIILAGKELILIAIVSTVISIPISYLWLDNWLTSFAYKSSLPVYIYIIPVLFIIILCVMIVSTQIAKLVKLNPVEALKDE
ncbi:MAG: ABC transporter permease [Cyclobacteriaceae bacterium]|nr:ABC transporter permease [Cyclobacteriaceae bacterium]